MGHLRCKYPKKNTKSLYVAGAWKHRKDMHQIMLNFESQGFNITRWWASDKENELMMPRDYMNCSDLGIHGIKMADTVVAFLTDPEYEYKGTFTEIGLGLGMEKRIIIVCDGTYVKPDKGDIYSFSHICMNNVFFWDRRIHHVSCYDDAVKLLRGEKVVSPYANEIVHQCGQCSVSCVSE